ncbi:MAG: SDR family oxidoreductase [Acidobacteria bacterium]|nr:SDR family oxidoreductase [Acidobacteriota bacterium]
MANTVVVTGCGAGIGRAIFDRLLADGYYVVGIEIDAARSADAEAFAGDSGKVVGGDVADRRVLDQALDEAVSVEQLAGWVNNAGVAIPGTLHAPDAEEVDRLLSVNLMGVFWGSATAVRGFVDARTGGSIVNISSIHGVSAFPGWAAYDMAKGGVDALTRYTAVEYGPVGIRANAIAPGAIRTELMQQEVDDAEDPEAMKREFTLLHPLGRLGEAFEIADVAAFLISENSSFLTGQTIAVDGGATARCYRFPPSSELLDRYGSDAN